MTENTGEVFAFKQFSVGALELDEAGVFPVRIYPSAERAEEGMYVRSVDLIPVE